MRSKSGVFILSLCMLIIIGITIGVVLMINNNQGNNGDRDKPASEVSVVVTNTDTEPVSISATLDKDVTLTLKNYSVNTNTESTAINCLSAKSLKIILAADSQNVIDGARFGIYAQCPVQIIGETGSSLTIKNCDTAINCTSNLKIKSTTLTIIGSNETTNQGIVMDAAATDFIIEDTALIINTSKKCIFVKADKCSTLFTNSTFNLSSLSSTAFESNSANKFTIVDCNNGGFNINNSKDGIDCNTDIEIKNTTLNINVAKSGIKAGGDISFTGSTFDIQTHGEFTRDKNAFYIFVPENSILSGADIQFLKEYYNGEYIKVPKSDISIYTSAGLMSYDLEKSKAIKSSANISIISTQGNIVSNDSAIDAELNVNIDKSALDIWTCNDAITCTDTLTIDDTSTLRNQTKINVRKSFECLEGHRLYIKGGNNSLTAFDDVLISKQNAATYTRHNTESFFYEPEVKVTGGNTYVYSHRDDGVDSDGNFLIHGGSLYMFTPLYGMASYKFQQNNVKYTLSDGSEAQKQFSGRMEIAKGATYLNVCQPFSTTLPTLSSAQNTLVLDIKGETVFQKNMYVGIVKLDGDDNPDNDDVFIFRMPSSCLTEPQYVENAMGTYVMQRFTGIQVHFSHPNIENSKYKVVYATSLFSTYRGPEWKTINCANWEDLDITNNAQDTHLYDYTFDFTNDTTQVFSTQLPTNEVVYGRSDGVTYNYNEHEYRYSKFARGTRMPKGTIPSIETNDDGTEHKIGTYNKQ